MQRNPLEEQPKEVLMNFKFSKELADNLRTVCKKEYRNMSVLVRRLIENYTQPRL
jgi:uncharacterized membrane-anchored protein YhcB (DUF1043 family)